MSELLSGIANLTKQVTTTFNNYEIRRVTDKMQSYIMNYTEAENAVREATNEDPWGPTGPEMKAICNYTFQYEGFFQVTEMLWKRMFEDNKVAWRRVYKSLQLLNYLLLHGSERVLTNARDHLYQLRSLENYNHIDEKGKDQGINIRHRVGIIIDLLQDEDKLRAERKKMKTETQGKYQGYTADEMRMERGPSSSTPKSYGNWNNDRKSDFDSGNSSNNSGTKEMNAFSFPEDRSNSNSPELGFRQQDNDDDGFGDFAQARQTANKSGNGGFADFSKFNQPKPTAPATSSAQPDLLGLDEPFPSATGSISISTNDIKLPWPPSGPNSPVTTSQFASMSLNNPEPSIDFFGGLNSAVVSPSHTSPPVSTADDVFGSFTSPSANATANEPNFADFGAYQTAPCTAAALQQPLPFDAFELNTPIAAAVAPSAVTANNGSASLLDLDFGSPSPVNQSVSFTSSSTAATTAPSVSTPKQPIKVGSTWAGTAGLIDLDNLISKPAPKANLSLNEMQAKKGGF